MGDQYLGTGTLNEHLDQLNAMLGKLEGDIPINGLALLNEMDAACSGIVSATKLGENLKSETAEFDYISSRLKKNARLLIQSLRPMGGLAFLRNQLHETPDEDRWWWYLDAYIDGQSRRNGLKVLGFSVIGGLIIFLLVFLYRTYFAPDPGLVAGISHSNNAAQFLVAGDVPSALGEINQGLTALPDDPDLLVQRGISLSLLGRNLEAEESFARAEQVLGSREEFLQTRSMQYLMINQFERAFMDADEVVFANPDSAQGLFLRAQSYQYLGYFDLALADYERAAVLADDQGNTTLAASIRVNMGMLMQSMQVEALKITPQITPSVTP